MAIKINSECICCNACLPECPSTAIYEPGIEWTLSDGTSVSGLFTMLNGTATDAGTKHRPLSNGDFYIAPDKCTECQGFHEEPMCISVCPVDACVPDEMYRETVDELMEKKEKLHL